MNLELLSLYSRVVALLFSAFNRAVLTDLDEQFVVGAQNIRVFLYPRTGIIVVYRNILEDYEPCVILTEVLQYRSNSFSFWVLSIQALRLVIHYTW